MLRIRLAIDPAMARLIYAYGQLEALARLAASGDQLSLKTRDDLRALLDEIDALWKELGGR